MYPYYNPQMAIRTFKLVQDKYQDARLTMAGEEGKESAICRRLVRDLNLRNVSFLGLVPNNEVPNLADRHDIHLHTSRVDNMPVTIIEMWACGVPVVGTDVGGMPYLVRDGVDGILVKSEDHHAMAAACLDLLSNHAFAGMLSRNGRARAEELTWEKIKPLWKQVLLLEDNLAEGSLAT
jgi:glycosyltransferase involved in cell wall biosynthesis